MSPSPRQVPHALLTRPPLSTPSVVRKLLPVLLVRLACVKHAASVRPEPGSNSLSIAILKALCAPKIAHRAISIASLKTLLVLRLASVV